jgi:hypothetical protein
MKRSPRSRLLAGSIAVLAVTSVVAACGDDDDAATTTTTVASERTAATVTDETSSAETVTDETDETTAGSDGSTPADGSASGDESDYVSALRDNISLDDDEMATCLSQAVIDEIGFDRIEASGLSPDEFASSGGQLSEDEPALTPEQAPALQAAFTECGELADAFITAESLPEDQKDCEREAITDEIAAALLANQLTKAENSEEVAAAVDQASNCETGASSSTTTTG